MKKNRLFAIVFGIIAIALTFSITVFFITSNIKMLAVAFFFIALLCVYAFGYFLVNKAALKQTKT